MLDNAERFLYYSELLNNLDQDILVFLGSLQRFGLGENSIEYIAYKAYKIDRQVLLETSRWMKSRSESYMSLTSGIESERYNTVLDDKDNCK